MKLTLKLGRVTVELDAVQVIALVELVHRLFG
jgi:hypothetical protein